MDLANPIFPGGPPPSIVGAWELNFRVRDGNGCVLPAASPELLRQTLKTAQIKFTSVYPNLKLNLVVKSSTIGIRPLHTLPHFHSGPINLVVYKGSYSISWETSSRGGLHT